MDNITEKDFMILEKYILSNLNENYAKELGLSEKDIQDINEGIAYFQSNIQEEGQNVTFHFACVYFLASIYTLTNQSKDNKILCLSKIATITSISSSLLTEPIFTYINRYHVNEHFSYLTNRDKQILDESGDSIFYNIFKYTDLNYYVQTIYPHLFTHNEIEELEKKLNECVENKTLYTDVIFQFINESENRVENKYEDRERYEQLLIKKILTNQIRINKENKDEEENIYNEIKFMYNSLIVGKYIVNQYEKEFEIWKQYSYREKILLYCTNNLKYTFFYNHYLYCSGRILFYLFSAINEPHALDIDHINYILEMAPKLRIASYLNDEYAKYKKLYNPYARDFVFGVDDPEEETIIEEQLLLESEQIEDEKKEKLHLDPLSRFTKEQLIKLLREITNRKDPFVNKETKQKNWLFVFGMNGDTPPKGFDKIKWEAKHNGRIAKGALIDFLELLGYDIHQLYELDSIKILNECFECYNKDNKLAPIDQNDFHYNKRTKERDHSKTFYDHFKRIIENIEKEA